VRLEPGGRGLPTRDGKCPGAAAFPAVAREAASRSIPRRSSAIHCPLGSGGSSARDHACLLPPPGERAIPAGDVTFRSHAVSVTCAPTTARVQAA
jgi:hypothetical protein